MGDEIKLEGIEIRKSKQSNETQESYIIMNRAKSQIDTETFCPHIKGNYIKCDYCNGYFDNNLFEDCHKNSCLCLEKDIIKCELCKNSVKIKNIGLHKKICSQEGTYAITNNSKCLLCKKDYNIDVIEDHINKCKPIESEEFFFEEKVPCIICNELIQIESIENHEILCQQVFIESLNDIKENYCIYPDFWKISGSKVELTDIILNSVEGEFVKTHFNMGSSCKIKKIWLVDNPELWIKYSKEKEKIINEKGDACEKFLFHGSKINNPQIICTTGFDISFSNDENRYGRGVYFARKSSYSQNYAFVFQNRKYMFLAKVLTGKHCVIKINPNLKKPPFIDEINKIYYDSVTDIDNPTDSYSIDQMFVVYNNHKAYPYYLIEYK